MLIGGPTPNCNATTAPPALECSNAAYHLIVHGVMYFRGDNCARCSLAHFLQLLEQQNFAAVVAQTHGVFGLFLFEKKHKRWLIVNDNGGLYRIYYDKTIVCTSLLELVRERGLGSAALSEQAAIGFIQHGGIFGRETIFSGIFKLTCQHFLEVRLSTSGQACVIEHRRQQWLSSGDATAVAEAHYADLAYYLSDMAVAVDTTGGFDTRLNICMLDHFGAKFDLSISSGRESADTKVAHEIEQMLGRQLHVYGHELRDIESDLRQSFEASDGQIDLRRFHRPWQAMRGKLADGMAITVHGGGGEHFGDFFYLQDWPLYNLFPLSFERFYSLRVAPVALPATYVHPRLRSALVAEKRRVMELLNAQGTRRAHESYNRAAYFVRAPEFFGQIFSAYINNGLRVVAPFLDREMVEAAFRQTAWGGFFEMWHRRMLKRHNPLLAALATDAGYSATIDVRYLARDLALYLNHIGLRTANKVMQKLGGRSFHPIGAFIADSQKYEETLRASQAFQNSLNKLKELEMFDYSVDPAQIRFAFVGRILTVGLWLEELSRIDRKGGGQMRVLPDSTAIA